MLPSRVNQVWRIYGGFEELKGTDGRARLFKALRAGTQGYPTNCLGSSGSLYPEQKRADRMSKLRKYDIANQGHFITTNTFKRRKIFVNEKACSIIIEDFKFYRKKFDFKLFGYVIMPDHIHCVILPNENTNISNIIRDFKKHTAKRLSELINDDEIEIKDINKKAKVYKIWQDGFYDFNIYSQKKLIEKLNYIHSDPVRSKLIENMEDSLYSSYRAYYQEDNYPIDIDKIF